MSHHPPQNDSERTGLLSRLGSSFSLDAAEDSALRFRRPRRRGVFDVSGSSGRFMHPRDALDPIVRGGTGSHTNKPEWAVKSVPAYPPHTRQSTRRAFMLFWIYKFRHWWKTSRLLVRLAGLYAYSQDPENWDKMVALNLMKRKGPAKALKLVKRLSQGGPVKDFLNNVKVLTRTIRIVAATWRWIEAPESRRFEVGAAEFMAFMGNRVARIFSRLLVDWFCGVIIFPFIAALIGRDLVDKQSWHSVVVLMVLGVLRAIAPFAASFQGSRFGRVVTRAAFMAFKDRWLPTMRVNDLNMESDDCWEWDEASPTYNDSVLIALAKRVASALGKESDHCDDLEPHDSNRYLQQAGFTQIGCGSGGYAVYSYRGDDGLRVMLHVTPYGPSILDELPRYVVLERETSRDTRDAWSQHVARFLFGGSPVAEGYCYKGAFFSSFHFAALKRRYDQELEAYDKACSFLCTSKLTANTPPTDLATLKVFLETGRAPNKKKKHIREHEEVQKQVDKLSRDIIAQVKARDESTGEQSCKAPWGVILYFEGLDCAGKSSTGNLVQAALENAGYAVSFRRHNRPPTAEQRKRPWMDRFDYPETTLTESLSYQAQDGTGGCQGHQHMAMIWDRGPAGDFVYGNLNKLSDAEKEERYQEFMEYSAMLRRKNILFCKLLYVTDRDSIARTLGKRLAQKKICRDLRTWLDSSNGSHAGTITREGLDEVEAHIDPTDFIAFNSYHDNLNKFMAFARNTDISKSCAFFNPWIVVSTSDRHAAKLQLLSRFEGHFDRFSLCAAGVMTDVCDFFGVTHDDLAADSKELEINLMDEHELMSFKKGMRLRARMLILSATLIFLLYVYYLKNFDDVF